MTRLEYLLSYQQADVNKQRIETDMLNTESRKKLGKLRRLLREQQGNIQKLTEEVESHQLTLARLISQQERLQRDLELNLSEMNTLAEDEECTAEEMTEFRKDVETIQKELGKVEKDVKSLSEQLENAIEQFQKTRSVAGKAKKEFDQLKSVCELEEKESAAAIAAADKELSRIEKQVDPGFLGKYRRSRQHHKRPVVPITQDKCSGCNMSLPMAVVKSLSGKDMILECENCGRILYSK